MIIGLAIFAKAGYFIANRVASWFGTAYFLKKGYRKNKWGYYVIGLLLSLAMFFSLSMGLRWIHNRKALKKGPSIELVAPRL